MTDREFVAAYMPAARTVETGTGIYADVLLAQWALETAWGNALFGNNLGNIRCSSSTFCQYATLEDFAAACVDCWHNGYYSDVLLAVGGTPQALMLAIGKSPWDAGHYGGASAPGSALVAYYDEVLAVDPVIQALTDQVNYLSGRLTKIDGELATILAAVKAVPGGGSAPAAPEPTTLTLKIPAQILEGTLS